MTFTSTSSHVSSAAYNKDKKQLTVHFKNGDVYTYNNVSLEDYLAFKVAPSHGKHLVKHIKDKYTYSKS